MKHSYIILASRPWLRDLALKLEECIGNKFYLVTNPQELAELNLEEINPRMIFVPHWSWIIPETIWGYYETVIFHMTDLPFGRGGSPLQNLIVQGYKDTKISALKCSKELDGGDIYLKQYLSLEGSAQEIFERSVPIIEEMVLKIIHENLTSEPQQGEPTVFERRKPLDSDISSLTNIKEVYDYIRMLDADGYPHAFFENDNFKFSFTKATLNDGEINAQVNISIKEKCNA